MSGLSLGGSSLVTKAGLKVNIGESRETDLRHPRDRRLASHDGAPHYARDHPLQRNPPHPRL